MTTANFINLDIECAKTGEQLAKANFEKLESALGVLEEQGIYAFFLYVKQNNNGNKIVEILRSFLKATPDHDALIEKNDNDIFAELQKLCCDLDKLLLANTLLRQVLVYAKHHAKVKESGN